MRKENIETIGVIFIMAIGFSIGVLFMFMICAT